MSNCFVCKNEATEEHHCYPVHLGGPVSGIKKSLCGNCHSFVHQSADRIYKGQLLDGRLALWYDRYQDEGRKLVKVVVQALINSETEDLSNSLVPIIFKVPRKVRDMMHLRKVDSHHSSLVSYILGLIVKDLGGKPADVVAILDKIRES